MDGRRYIEVNQKTSISNTFKMNATRCFPSDRSPNFIIRSRDECRHVHEGPLVYVSDNVARLADEHNAMSRVDCLPCYLTGIEN